MMPAIDIVASRMRRRANGSVFLTEMDIAEITRDFLGVNDAVQLYDLVGEITCIAAFFNAGDGPEVARILMQRVLPAVSSRAASLAAMTHGGTRRPPKPLPEEASSSVKGAFKPPEATRIGINRRHST
ncbi:MAG: hypothetical protein ACAI38_21990 [Myxococcota bacterium]|nr:hypothetical protein [Myxococcota bacterium]